MKEKATPMGNTLLPHSHPAIEVTDANQAGA
jgi:hypothetical protein